MRNIIVLTLALLALPVAAQNSLPGLDNFTLDRSRTPQPSPTPTASSSAAPSAAATAVPTPPPAVVALPTPRPSATVRVSADRAVPAAAPTATPAPTASPTPTSTPSPLPAGTPAGPAPYASARPLPATVSEGIGWLSWPSWLALGGVVIAAVGALLWWRRRPDEVEWDEPAVVSDPAPSPVAPPAVAPLATPDPIPARPKAPGGLITTALRPEITFSLRPVNAGIDALRATLDFELSIANSGRAPAYEVAIETWLAGAGNNPHGELDRLLALPLGQPVLPTFALSSSAAADLAGQVVAPREALPPITAGDRKLFVPMLVVRATYRDGQGAVRTASDAFVVGIERPEQDRLVPLALDRGTRRYDALAARRLAG